MMPLIVNESYQKKQSSTDPQAITKALEAKRLRWCHRIYVSQWVQTTHDEISSCHRVPKWTRVSAQELHSAD